MDKLYVNYRGTALSTGSNEIKMSEELQVCKKDDDYIGMPEQGTQSSVLPYDLLLAIMDVSPRHLIMKMMSTCHALRRGGARYLLCRGVVLSDGQDSISFIKFMLADPALRFRSLNDLTISGSAWDPSNRRGTDALCGLLGHPLLSIKSLRVMDPVTLVLADRMISRAMNLSTSPVCVALSKIATLTTLTIAGCDSLGRGLLALTPSSLVTVTLHLEVPNSWSDPEPDSRNPIVLLRRFAQTLQELSGSGFDIAPNVIKYDIVYPAIVRLSATYTSASMPATLAYMNAFPNLEYLSLTSQTQRMEGEPSSISVVSHLFDISLRNRQDQTTFGGGWERLREVTGSVVDVFVLGLLCHVPTLRIMGNVSGTDCQFLLQIVSDTRPTTMILAVAGSLPFAESRQLPAVLRHPAAQHLRTLEVEICLTPYDRSLHLDELINRVAAALSLAPLQSLTLVFNYKKLQSSSIRKRRTGREPHRLERELRDMDVSLYEARFMAIITTLANISICAGLGRTSHLHSFNADVEHVSLSSDEDEDARDLASFVNEENDPGW